MIQTSQIFDFLDKKADVHVNINGNRSSLSIPKDNFLHWLPNFDKKDKELIVNVHGGGHSHSYQIGDAEGKNRAIENYFFGTHQHGDQMKEAIKKLRDQEIHSVHSIACNGEGGGRPEFYEKLLDKDLTDVIMTPPGYVGIFGQHFSNGPAKLYNGLNYITGGHATYAAPQHHYQKVDGFFGDRWEDKGEYYPLVDRLAGNHWVQAGVGVGMAGLAYGLYKKHKNKKKLEALKNNVLKTAQAPHDTLNPLVHGAEMAEHIIVPIERTNAALEATHHGAHAAKGIASGTSAMSKIPGLTGAAKGMQGAAKLVAPITNSPVFKAVSPWVAPVALGTEATAIFGQGNKGVNNAVEKFQQQSPLGAIKNTLLHPAQTLVGIGGTASDMYHGAKDISQLKAETAQITQANQTLQQQHQQRWAKEDQAVQNSPLAGMNGLSPRQINQQFGDQLNYDGGKAHFAQNTNTPGHQQMAQSQQERLAKNNGIPRMGDMVVNGTPSPTLAQAPKSVPSTGMQSKSMLAGPAPQKPTLGGPLIAGANSGGLLGGTPGSNPNIGKQLLEGS